MRIKVTKDIQSDFQGLNNLLNLLKIAENSTDESFILDFIYNKEFDGNLLAVISALIQHLKESGKNVELDNIGDEVIKVINRNYNSNATEQIKLHNNIVVNYRNFKRDEDVEFIIYTRDELLIKPNFPKLSEQLRRKIIQSILEVFDNARIHGRTTKIVTCDYLNIKSEYAKLEFTIVDLGRTIKSNVNEYLKRDLMAMETIDWAMQYGNTTKQDNKPGGLGLDILRQFIDLNHGKIQIISSDGYWEYQNKNKVMKKMNNVFPGTIVNIEFDLNDNNSYQLTEEISLKNIF